MIRRPPCSTRSYTLFPYTTLFRSDDHVLHPVVDEEIAVRVEIARVAGANPAIVGHRRRGRIGQVPVPQHIVRRARDDLAHLAGRHRLAVGPAHDDFDPRQRLARRRSEALRVGKECVSPWRYRWASSHYKKTSNDYRREK